MPKIKHKFSIRRESQPRMKKDSVGKNKSQNRVTVAYLVSHKDSDVSHGKQIIRQERRGASIDQVARWPRGFDRSTAVLVRPSSKNLKSNRG